MLWATLAVGYLPLNSEELEMSTFLLLDPAGIWEMVELEPRVRHYGRGDGMQ